MTPLPRMGFVSRLRRGGSLPRGPKTCLVVANGGKPFRNYTRVGCFSGGISKMPRVHFTLNTTLVWVYCPEKFATKLPRF